jgi:hypothetical protein
VGQSFHGTSRILAGRTPGAAGAATAALLVVAGQAEGAVRPACGMGRDIFAGGKVNRPADLKRNLIYVIIAEATNMGLTAMAASCGIPYDVLAWTAE